MHLRVSRIEVFSVVFLISACQGSSSRASVQIHGPTPTALPVLPTVLISRPPAHQVELVPIPEACAEATSPRTPLGRLRNAMRNTTYTQMQMQSHSFFDAFIVFYTDEHLSEEPAPEERRLEYVSGWSGVGTAAITADGAALWVPGGDLQRARRAVGCAWIVLDADDASQPTIAEWISERLVVRRGGRVGADARLASIPEWESLTSALQKENHQLIDFPSLVDQLWNEETDARKMRPEFSKIVANVHDKEFIGVSWLDKVAAVRAELNQLGADAMVVTALDEVAWLLNVRGRDVPHAPLLKAFVVITHRDVRVYTPPGKLSMPVRDVLAVYNCHQSISSNCTRVVDYATIYSDLRRSTDWNRILIPAAGTFQRGASAAINRSVPIIKRLSDQLSPIIYLKAQKNNAEVNGMKVAHLRDAVAMSTLFSYLEGTFRRGLTEMSLATKVDVTRATQARHIGMSMETRVSFGASGALPDYLPTNATDRRLYGNATIVIRSGGQYEEGTTLVSRTIHFGIPTRDEKRAYTTTLRSLVALASLKAQAELPACHMDPVVRAPLWAHMQDYPHPTGYGVGAALKRREDPVVIDYRQDTNLHTLREGYFIFVEPAWYEAGKYGIRLGNILQVVPAANGFIGFSETTLLPYEPKLIDKSLLTDYEISWINDYNGRIRKHVGPELKSQGLMDVYYWMMNKTVPMEMPSKAKKYVSGADTNFNKISIGVAIILACMLSF